MKLLTYEFDGQENWGFLVEVALFDEPRVFNPATLVKHIQKTVQPTSSLWISGCRFEQDWPDDLVSFLALEEKGMAELKRLYEYLLKVLEGGGDAALLTKGSLPLSSVIIKAPVPRPKLYFGIVQNGPPFFRNNPSRHNANLFPQGHNRTQGSVLGHNGIMVFKENSDIFGSNVEFGIVIGKKGRYIPAKDAMDYVAGYVPIIDACTDAYFNAVNGEHKCWQTPDNTDWFQEAMMSWCGKKVDTLAPMGPCLVTKDEIVNVYDLLCYNRQSGLLRDRTYTGCHLLGVERMIHWFSSFATLYPGDILHLGTMGVDGLFGSSKMPYGPDDDFEVEIEKIGTLKSRIVMEHIDDWRDDQDPSKTIHPSPAVRDLIKTQKDVTKSPQDWQLSDCCHYWTTYGNYKDVKKCEGREISSYPRMLNTPISSLSTQNAEVEIPPRATTIDIGIELGCVLKKVACRVDAKNADDYILGYTPLISISDQSFADVLVQPATPQENALPIVYGRWADKFNTVLEKPAMSDTKDIYNQKMTLEVSGFGEVQGSTNEYVLNFAQILEFMTRYITMFPGDIITLGRIASRITVPTHTLVNAGPTIKAKIEGLPDIEITIKQDKDRKENVIKKIATVYT